MIYWINGCFGVGKTTVAAALHEKLHKSYIYDPEEVGAFLWNNSPKEMQRRGDFQDIPLWRSINYDFIKYICDSYDGDIVIPMTLVNPDYYDEIIGHLRRDGITVRHYILTAPREVIIGRLISRGDGENSWAAEQIDRCMTAFSTCIEGTVIDTSMTDAKGVAELILKNSSSSLPRFP